MEGRRDLPAETLRTPVPAVLYSFYKTKRPGSLLLTYAPFPVVAASSAKTLFIMTNQSQKFPLLS